MLFMIQKLNHYKLQKDKGVKNNDNPPRLN